MNKIRQLSKKISNQSEHVKIEESGIDFFCTSFKPEKMRHWLADAPYNIQKLNIEDRLAYLTTFNSISFSYWGDPKWTIRYDEKQYDGAWAMLTCVGKAIQEKSNIFNSDYLSRLSIDEFKKILFGNIEIPLITERLEYLHEVGQVVTNKYLGSFRNIVEEGRYDADKILEVIIRDFPSFQDVSQYGSEKVEFYKRARLLVSDISHNCRGKHGFELSGIENLTACADYKLPQVMRRYGILNYSAELSAIIDSKTEIPSGDKKEVEIRANTIQAVELIKQRLCRTLPEIKSMDINDYLWLEGQIKLPTDRPYHRTRTTAY
jgi:hypothetical protein